MAMMQMRCPHCTTFHAIGPSAPSTKGENPFWIVSQHINAQHADLTFLCPRRAAGAGTRAQQAQRDFWCTEPSGDKTCSYCGSVSEDDLREILQGFVAGKTGYRFLTTDKADKVYVNRPGVTSGAIKFHLQHLSRSDADSTSVLARLFDQAIARELGNHG